MAKLSNVYKYSKTEIEDVDRRIKRYLKTFKRSYNSWILKMCNLGVIDFADKLRHIKKRGHKAVWTKVIRDDFGFQVYRYRIG